MTTSSKHSISIGRAGFLIVALALVLRLLNCYFMAESPLFAVPTSDEQEHFALASKIATEGWLAESEGILWRPALFAWVCAAVFSVTGISYMAVHLLVLVCDLVAVGLWFRIAAKCFGPRTGIVAGIGMALYVPFIHFSSTGYMESFALMMLGGMVYCTVTCLERLERNPAEAIPGRPRLSAWLVGAGVLTGLCILTRPTVMILVPGMAVLLALAAWRGRGHALRAVAVLAVWGVAVVAGVFPNALRHRVVAGEWVWIGSASEIAFHMGNNNGGWGWHASSPGLEYDIYRDTPVALGGRPLTVEAAREYWSEQNRRYVQEDTADFLKGLAIKAGQIWNHYEIHLTNDFQEHKRLSPVERWSLPSAVVLPLGLTGLIYVLLTRLGGLLRRRDQDSPIVCAQLLLPVLVLLYLGGTALYMANTRHRLPAMPALIVLGGLAVTEMMRLAGERKTEKARLALLLLLVAGGVAISRLPVIPDWMPLHERWWTSINKGVALNKLQRYDEAAETYREANQLMPEKLEGWRQLAIVEESRGLPESAATAQRELIRLLEKRYPQYTATLSEEMEILVGIELRAGKTESAMAGAERLASLAPNHFRPHLMLAQVALADGQTSRALQHLATAETLAGDEPAVQEVAKWIRGRLGE